jgi:hypothetical protein
MKPSPEILRLLTNALTSKRQKSKVTSLFQQNSTMNHLRPFALSRIIGVFTVSLFLIANSSILFAQSDAFKNGSFETQTNGHPDGWYFPAILSESGITMSLDSATPFEGNQSALVDTTKLDAADPRTFGMLNQILDPKNFQGKRVRFRAAVKTAERTNEGRAQLWLRVDRKPETGQRGSIGAFDNMQDRPITVDDWQHFEIVADIEEDAVRLTVGMLVMGKTKAWIDGASLEIVDEEVTTTAKRFQIIQSPIKHLLNHSLMLGSG